MLIWCSSSTVDFMSRDDFQARAALQQMMGQQGPTARDPAGE